GSTGRPKGVSVTHRGVLRLVCNNDYAELNSQQVIMHGSNVAFDAATFEVWGALLNGGRLVVSRERVASAAALRRQIEEGGVKTMWLTASLYNAVAEEGLEQLRGLEQLLIGGEALSVRHVRAGVEKLEGTRLINGYGPTEATTFSCCHEIAEADVRAGVRSVPIGRAIANTEVYVLGRGMGVLPVGAVGELYIGGDGLARGYLGEAEQTAERFVPHPYSREAGARLYRSGDLCRWNWQGRIEYVGRADQQVKVRGYRIELGEIEAALAGCAGVKQAAVEVKLEGGDKRLVGYVVGREGETLSPRQLREQLRGKLPDYMVPGWIEVMAAMPLTVGGKLDRRRLRQREVEAGQREVGSRRAATPIEEVVSGIYGEVLRIEEVGVEENFFDVGGHSLLATQVVSRISDSLKVDVSLMEVFEEPTVAGLSQIIERRLRQARGPALPPIQRRRHRGGSGLPLSYAQQRLWFIDQLVPGRS